MSNSGQQSEAAKSGSPVWGLLVMFGLFCVCCLGPCLYDGMGNGSRPYSGLDPGRYQGGSGSCLVCNGDGRIGHADRTLADAAGGWDLKAGSTCPVCGGAGSPVSPGGSVLQRDGSWERPGTSRPTTSASDSPSPYGTEDQQNAQQGIGTRIDDQSAPISRTPSSSAPVARPNANRSFAPIDRRPTTRRRLSCRVCGGSGLQDCVSCEGGWRYCYSCAGSGYSSYLADQQGNRVPCMSCQGTGAAACFLCNGAGATYCTYCGGSGRDPLPNIR